MELLNRLKEHYGNGLPFAIYRKPDTASCKAILQKDKSLEKVTDFNDTGFVMAPFNEGLPVFIIKGDEILEESVAATRSRIPFEQFGEDTIQPGKEEYLNKIRQTLELIEAKKLNKVVLSRRIISDINPDPFDTFQILLGQFPEAFCYFLYHPKTGIWMGASPEILLSYNKKEVSTVSLAGTQKAVENKDADWNPKEKKEQQYVTRYIEEALAGLADPPEVSEPITVKAGNLLHLKTFIRANNPRAALSEFVKALHPTPAVCGIPASEAKDYLLANEGYDRSYYTGFLGEINWGEQRQSHLFVNLRCMSFQDDQVHVYVGGGLVEGSDPEMEWQETVHKSQSMLHLLRNSVAGLG